MTEQTHNELRRLEEAVNAGEGTSLYARWHWGQYTSTLKVGRRRKLLPPGVREMLTNEFGIRNSEITARLRFAEKFSEAQLADVIGKYKTWFAITHEALTTKTRPAAQTRNVNLQRVLMAMKRIDTTNLGEQDAAVLAVIATTCQRLQAGIVTVKAVAA